MGSLHGAQGLREEMSDVIEKSERMREEHSSLLRLSQVRSWDKMLYEDLHINKDSHSCY